MASQVNVEYYEVNIDLLPELEKIQKETIEQMADMAKSIANKRTGHYANSFYTTDKLSLRYAPCQTLANEVYQLTHLLEDGHFLPNGKTFVTGTHFLQQTTDIYYPIYLNRVQQMKLDVKSKQKKL